MSPTLLAALRLIQSNPRDLRERGHLVLNAGVPSLLRQGLITYAPDCAIAYRLTPAGRDALSAST